MAIRLALMGAVLIVAGVLNLGGLGTITGTVGAVALAASGVTWIAARRSRSS